MESKFIYGDELWFVQTSVHYDVSKFHPTANQLLGKLWV